MESLPSVQNLKKRLVSKTVNSSMTPSMNENEVVLIAPPVTPTRKSRKRKEAIVPNVIEIDDDEDSDYAMVMDKKSPTSNKGKAINYSSNDHQEKFQGAVANTFVSSGKSSSSSASHKVPIIDVDDYVGLQSHFGYQQSAKSIKVDGPSSSASNPKNGDYTGLYLDEFIDIDEYAKMTALFDEIDVPPGKEAHIPFSLSLSDSKSSVKAVSGSSSDLQTQKGTSVNHLGISSSSSSSSWILPQVPSSEKKQSYSQHQGSASWIGSSKFPTQTQNDDSGNQVSTRINTEETTGEVNGFKQFDTVEDHSDHHYTKKSQLTEEKNWAKKIQDEWKILEKDLPDMISVRVYETRMDLLRSVIVGAEGTPYHDGLFFFDVSFPSGYPNVPPHVYYHSGGLRPNPNLYASGKVCLSLLNTWSGEQQERWLPGKSTMLQVLVSIQGLILNSEPYFNEPGWAPTKGTSQGTTLSKTYSEDTFILSLRTMVYTMKKPPKYFEDFVKGHFRKRAHYILGACKAYMEGAEVGSLVKGAVQDVNSNKSCSEAFKNSVAQFLPTLVKALTQIGAKDCEKFLPPTTVGNK